MRKLFASLLLLVGLCADAGAVPCFWVGGTANWDGTNTGGGGAGGIKWASTTGGGTTCAGAGAGGSPGATDTAQMDANSGGGTVTITIDVTIQGLTWGAFAGTIDNSANHNMTFNAVTGFVGTGAGARTFLGGTGTYAFTSAGATWNMTATGGLTNPATAFSSATITFSGVNTSTTSSFNSNNCVYGTLNLNAIKSSNLNMGSTTIATLNITGPNAVKLAGGTTLTVTNAFAWTGTSSAPLSFDSGNIVNGLTSITTGSGTTNTASWASFGHITFIPVGGSTLTATNSLDTGLNSGTGFTITPPSGGSRCIGC